MRLRSLLFALPPMVMSATPAAAQPTCAEMPARPAPVFVTFYGVSTILIRAGDQAIMVDGFFSRPNLLRTVARPLVSHERRIRRGLDSAGLHRLGRPGGPMLRALLVAQGHHDHSMDAGQVAYMTDATLVGSPSTINIATGSHPSLPVRTVERSLEECFGPFGVRAILSPHSPGFIPWLVNGRVREPMLSRRHALAYRDELNFSFRITYGAHTILVHPSANHPPVDDPAGGLGNIGADLVFFSFGDLGQRSREEIQDYWRAVAQPSKAHVIVPIHYDNFLRPVSRPRRGGSPRSPGGPRYRLPRPLVPWQFDYAWEAIEGHASNDCVQIRFLPAFEEVSLDRLLAEGAAHRASCLTRRAAGEAG